MCQSIPQDFGIASGIDKRNSLRLKDDQGRKWPVHVVKIGRNRFALCKGWNDFLKSNNVVVGSTISFMVNSKRTTIKAHVEREGSNSGALFKYVKRRGNKKKYELFMEENPNRKSFCFSFLGYPKASFSFVDYIYFRLLNLLLCSFWFW